MMAKDWTDFDDPQFFDADNEQRRRKSNGQAPKRFPLVRSRDIRLDNSPNCLVHGLIPREGLTIVWGPPKCGKTFWVYDLMMHVALDWEYRGRRVEAGTVVYIACEGERGLAARNAAFRQAHLSEDADPPFYLLTTRLDLPSEVDPLILDIAAQIPSEPCGAIVLDTLNRSLAGSESKDEDMSAYVVAADALRERFKCAVVIIHHCGVNDTRPRGHTSLTGACDAQIAVKHDDAGKIVATLEWMKDGPENCEIASRLEPVAVGIDDNGTPITSCVVVPTETGAKTERGKKQPALPPAAKIALKQLRNAIIDHGKEPPNCKSIPHGKMAVDIDLWRRYAYQGGVSDGDSPAAKRTAFARAMERLVADEIVGIWNEWAWIC